MTTDIARITGVEAFVGHTSFRNLTLVKVSTDAGIVGWGDATLAMREHAVVSHVEFLDHLVRGADAFAPAAIWQDIVGEDFFMRDDIVGRSAVSGVMVACTDIMARGLGVPVYRMLGGPTRSQVPAYANGWFRGERTPENAAACARTAVDKGYRALKFDPFGTAATLATNRELNDASALVAAVRDEVGPDVEIYIDAHGRFTLSMARRAAELLAESRIGFLEEPIAPTDFAGLRKLRETSPVPIAAGERSTGRDGHRALIEGDCVDILQPDIAWSGGIFEVHAIARWAETHGMVVAVHNFASPIGTAAGCHLGMSLTNFLCQEIFEDFDEPWVREAFPTRVQVTDGVATVPDRPGLGVTPTEELLAGHPMRPVFHRLRSEGWETMDGVVADAVDSYADGRTVSAVTPSEAASMNDAS